MFAFRAVVVLMARELPPGGTTFLWEVLMAAGDHLVEPEYDQSLGGGGRGAGSDKGGGEEDEAGASSSTRGLTRSLTRNVTRGGSGGSSRRLFFRRPEEGAGGGRMFLHVVAAFFLQSRNVVFGQGGAHPITFVYSLDWQDELRHNTCAMRSFIGG